MKILAIGRNYAEHIKELNNERHEELIFITLITVTIFIMR